MYTTVGNTEVFVDKCGCIFVDEQRYTCFQKCPIHLWEHTYCRRYDGPLTMPTPKARIRWGNVIAYLSLLGLVAVMLWVLIDYTNVPR